MTHLLRPSVRLSMRNAVAMSFGLAGLVLVSSPAVGADPVRSSEAILSQATTETSQTFSDLPPDHWAYEAIQSLISNYGCLAGYPDDTFRGDQALTRNEFAAGMNACMDAISGSIQQRQQANQAEREELIRSMQQLHNELDALEGEVGL
ncbi:MAG TPA: iron uptake porin [Leptolyngbyaceae cyanobacterium]